MEFSNSTVNNSIYSVHPSIVGEQLMKGYEYYLELTKNTNNVTEKMKKIEENSNKEKYLKIISGLLYGILYDYNNSDLYFQLLYVVNKDNYDSFLFYLFNLIEECHMEFTPRIYEQIYMIFDKLAHMNNNKLIEIMNLLCRCIYPGFNLLDNPNHFLNFLRFIKSKLNWIIENTSENENLSGKIFIKILRLLSETHFFQNNANNNTGSQKELFKEITNEQVIILSKLYSVKKNDILKIGRELIRILIQIAKCDIEIINTISEDIAKNNNYYSILSKSYQIQGYDEFVQMNIPPLMEKMIIFILTKVKKSTSLYVKYLSWISKKFNLETAIGQTMLVDISRYIITNYFFYKNNSKTSDPTPRWLLLGYFLKIIKNELISALIKQAIFYDWICFKKDKDNVNLIEPAVQIIFYSAKEYPDLTMELLEFLDCYSEYFDKNNKNICKNCIYDAFKAAEATQIVPNLLILLKEEKISPEIKKIYQGMIKYNQNINQNNQNPLNTMVNSNLLNNAMNPNLDLLSLKMMKNDTNIKNVNCNIRANTFNSPVDYSNNYNPNRQVINPLQQEFEVIPNQIIPTNNEINVNNNRMMNNQVGGGIGINKEVEKEYFISQSFNNLISPTILKNFLNFKSIKTFYPILDDLCKSHINKTKSKNSLESKLSSIEPSYIEFLRQFANFYFNSFKDEILLDTPYINFETNVSMSIYEYMFSKMNSNEFSFLSDIINKLIEIYPNTLVNLMVFITSKNNRTNNMIGKICLNFISKIFDFNQKTIKEKLHMFINLCVDNFYIEILNFFFNNGLGIFSSSFFDDEQLIFDVVIYANVQSINSISLNLLYGRYILFDKNIYKIIKYSFDLSSSEQNKLWNLIYSQGKLPSSSLKEFIENFIEFSKLYISKTKNEQDELFNHFSKGIKNLFKNEIFGISQKSNYLDLNYLFEFNCVFSEYVYGVFIIVIENFGKDGTEKFFNIIDEYIKRNQDLSSFDKVQNFLKIMNIICYCEREKEKTNNKGYTMTLFDSSNFTLKRISIKIDEIIQKFNFKME